MKKKEKMLILVLLIILAIVVTIAVRRNKVSEQEVMAETESGADEVVEEFVQVLEDGTKLNTSDELNAEKNVDGLRFENIQLTNRGGQSVLLADVTNTTEAATDVTLVDVIISDKEGNELGTIGGIIAPLEPGESTQFNSSTTIDYANAYNFEVVKK